MGIYCVLTVVSLLTFVTVKAEAKASNQKVDCVVLLSARTVVPEVTREDLYSLYDAVESEAIILSTRLSAEENVLVQNQLEEMSDLVLRGAPVGQVKNYGYNLVSSMRGLLRREPGTVGRAALAELLDAPELLRAGISYMTRHRTSAAEVVIFESRLVKEVDYLQGEVLRKFFGSIEKGFVPSLSGPGIYRLTNIDRRLVEIKIKGDGGHLRMMGCMEDGVLRLKRLHTKRGNGDGGQLNIYRDLCAS